MVSCRAVGCNCKKSRCLKLYCECYSKKVKMRCTSCFTIGGVQVFCSEDCNCADCLNIDTVEVHKIHV